MVQEKERKIDFQDGDHGGYLGFLNGTILAIFDLQVAIILPTKFCINWLFSSREEMQNRFSKWQPLRHLEFLIGTILAIFDLHVTPILLTKFQVNWPFGSEEAQKRFSRYGNLGFWIKMFLAFFDP